MSKWVAGLALLVSLMLVRVVLAAEEQSGASAGAEWAMDSRFVWRGIAASAGPVVQPSVYGALHGVTLSSSAAIPVDEARDHHISVVSGELTYAWGFRHLQLEPGALLYANLIEPLTAELALAASYGFGPVRVISSNFVDVRRAAGGYFGTLGLSWEREVHPWSARAFVDLGWATAPYNLAWFGVARAALELAELGVSTRVDVADWMYLGLHAELSALLSPALARSLPQGAVLVNGGASLGFEID